MAVTGQPTPLMREILNEIRFVQDQARVAIAPRRLGREVYEFGRSATEQCKFGKRFGFVAHGMAKALDREIALRCFGFCYRSSIEPGPDSFPTRTAHDVKTSTRIRVSGLFNLKLADRSSAHPLQRSTERESARGKTGE